MLRIVGLLELSGRNNLLHALNDFLGSKALWLF